MNEVWKQLKDSEIDEGYTSHMSVGDYFIYTGNIDKNGHYNGKKKYIFKLVGDMQFSKFGSTNTWTVTKDKQKFANVKWLINKYGIDMLKEIALEDDFDKYISTEHYASGLIDISDNITTDDKPNLRKYSGGLIFTDSTVATNLNKEENKMSEKVKDLIEDNADAAKVAAKIVAGDTLNSALMEKVVPQLPLLVRGYASTPLGKIVLANLVNFGVDNFMQDNPKAAWVADAMMVAAMTDALSSFNLEKILKEVIDTAGVVIPEVSV